MSGENCKTPTFKSKEEVLDHYISFYLDIPESFIDKVQKIIQFLNTELYEQLNNTYYFAFTGGKDCLAALIIMKLYYFLKKQKDFSINKKVLNSFFTNYNNIKLPKSLFKVAYFMNVNNYEEEENYIIQFIKEEDLEIIYIYSDFVSGLKLLINKYNMQYILMGTRYTDLPNNPKPNSETLKNVENREQYQFLHKSTHPYPEFIRVYPIFHFDYEDIWRLILHTKIKYLDLYNRGYSSIGSVKNSKVNEHLLFNKEILPAWCMSLEFEYTERDYR